MGNDKYSNLLKFEATMLFTQVKHRLSNTTAWPYFEASRRDCYSLQLTQSISPYRASLHFRYVHSQVIFDVYLEREAYVGEIGQNMWSLSFPGIEGKAHALMLRNILQPLISQGYDVPNGEDYLDRQMQFSLGLYAACLNRVDIHFPTMQSPFECFCQVFDLLEASNLPLSDICLPPVVSSDDDDDYSDTDMMLGDWQTWK
ncbi:MAG: hypothetical protein KBT20_02765 [Bacteroidales bacterium]|nr:hypothetical protein [Candidatus Liminaster caballi]